MEPLGETIPMTVQVGPPAQDENTLPTPRFITFTLSEPGTSEDDQSGQPCTVGDVLGQWKHLHFRNNHTFSISIAQQQPDTTRRCGYRWMVVLDDLQLMRHPHLNVDGTQVHNLSVQQLFDRSKFVTTCEGCTRDNPCPCLRLLSFRIQLFQPSPTPSTYSLTDISAHEATPTRDEALFEHRHVALEDQVKAAKSSASVDSKLWKHDNIVRRVVEMNVAAKEFTLQATTLQRLRDQQTKSRWRQKKLNEQRELGTMEDIVQFKLSKEYTESLPK